MTGDAGEAAAEPGQDRADSVRRSRNEGGGDSSGYGRAPDALRWMLGLLLALALLWTLRLTVSITLPVAIAIIIAFSVWPVSQWVQGHVPKRLGWLGNSAALALVVLILVLVAGGISLAAQQLLQQIPQEMGPLRERAVTMARDLKLERLLGGPDQISGALGRGVETVAGYAKTLLGVATSAVAGLVLVFFLVLLMLAEAFTWRAKLDSLSGGRDQWSDAVTAIGQRFRHYFLARMLLGAATGALYAGYLALFGVDLLLVWGILAFLLNFIPTVGSLIAGLLPILYAALTKDPTTALLVAGGLLVIEQVMGNYIDPKVLGRQLAISPLVILISLLLWSWVWGVVGALVAVPMTVLLIVVFANVPALRPVALLLSDERDIEGLIEHTRPED